jgi:hypothetical protein
MVVAMSLLFTMKNFAERQQFYTAPRQAARRAAEYTAGYITGATDLNNIKDDKPNPNALVMWYSQADNNGNKGPRACASGAIPYDSVSGNIQASYNNVDGTEPVNAKNTSTTTSQASCNNGLVAPGSTCFGDIGTDIISFSVPVKPLRIPVARWPGFQHAANVRLDYDLGCCPQGGAQCGDDLNMLMFAQDTGGAPPCTSFPCTQNSDLIGMYDANGTFVYFQITHYLKSDCASATDKIHVVANPGNSGGINPPSGHPGLSCTQGKKTGNCYLTAGQKFYSFRVRTDPTTLLPNLEQKTTFFFDPCTDNPGTAFVPLIENIEDMQVAYAYSSDQSGANKGLIYNTSYRDSSSLALTSVAIPAVGGTSCTVNGLPGLANPDTYWVTNGGGPTCLPTKGIPPQAGQVQTTDGSNAAPNDPAITPGIYDITKVKGLRVTFTARSLALSMAAKAQRESKGRTKGFVHPEYNYQPESEDHTYSTFTSTSPGPDVYDHYKMTSLLMIRNRMLGY